MRWETVCLCVVVIVLVVDYLTDMIFHTEAEDSPVTAPQRPVTPELLHGDWEQLYREAVANFPPPSDGPRMLAIVRVEEETVERRPRLRRNRRGYRNPVIPNPP